MNNLRKKRFPMTKLNAWKMICGVFILCTATAAFAQQERQYNFNGANGDFPRGGLLIDAAGNFYGITNGGGTHNLGVVYELSPAGNGKVTETVLYGFTGANGDGAYPIGDLVFDGAGNLYGVTTSGGVNEGGTVFELSPPTEQGSAWTETVLYRFQNSPDGASPVAGVILDASGNLYGTTQFGGISVPGCERSTCGVVYELTPPSAPGASWTESVLYEFQGFPDGSQPMSRLVFDGAGNLYGTTYAGGALYGQGSIFQLAPPAMQGQSWTETQIHSFGPPNGCLPEAGVVIGAKGALYGTASACGTGNNGSVYVLTQPQIQGGHWTFAVLHKFSGSDGMTPATELTLMGVNALFGTASGGGSMGWGTVFQLSRAGSGWSETTLYSFDSGRLPLGTLAVYNGAIYGTASEGGYNNHGVVYQINP
jgi:uncharacterized repeat protein (TIGR03803 family)